MHKLTHIIMYACMYACFYVCMFMCLYVCMSIHIYRNNGSQILYGKMNKEMKYGND